MPIKVLNLYAGMGGNRRYWDDVDVTAVEYDEEIANVYRELYPNDKVIVTDAHEYLLEHFEEFDFIWASPPCPSHSCLRKMGCSPMGTQKEAQNKPIYPDMKLYEEIIFLEHYFKGKYCVENVMPYYEPLIKAKKLQRHLFWTNFPLNDKKFESDNIRNNTNEDWKNKIGIDLSKYGIKSNKARMIYRNCVDSHLSKYIFDMAYKEKQVTLF